MENQNAEKPGLLWAGYIALILFTFWMYFQSLYGIGLLLGLAVLIVGIAARGRFRSQGRTFAAAHASWQVNTIWIAIVLFLSRFFHIPAYRNLWPGFKVKVQL